MSLLDEIREQICCEMDRRIMAEHEESMRPKPKPKMRRAWLYADGRKVYCETQPTDQPDFPLCAVDEKVPTEPPPPNRRQRRAEAARQRGAQ